MKQNDPIIYSSLKFNKKKYNMKKLFIIIPISILLFSCSNNDETVIEAEPTPNNSKIFTFTYENVKYSSTYTFDTDSTIILDDKNANKVIQEVRTIPDLLTIFEEDGTFTFKKHSNFVAEINENIEKVKQTKSSEYGQASVQLYEHENLGGRQIGLYINNANPSAAYRDLKEQNFGDITSSLTISNSFGMVVTAVLYENHDFGGHSIGFPNTGTFRQINNLKDYDMVSGIIGIGKKKWGDRASSVRLFKGL